MSILKQKVSMAGSTCLLIMSTSVPTLVMANANSNFVWNPPEEAPQPYYVIPLSVAKNTALQPTAPQQQPVQAAPQPVATTAAQAAAPKPVAQQAVFHIPPTATASAPATHQPQPAVTAVQKGKASYYGGKFHGRKTASGERFDQNKLTCAHGSLPFGCRLRVTNLRNNKTVEVKVNDRGAFHKYGRVIDLSKAAAKKIGMIRSGVTDVKIEVLE